MIESQFCELADLSGLGQNASREASRLVLVCKYRQNVAATETGLSVAGVSNAVRRCQRTLDLARRAVGVEVDSPKIPQKTPQAAPMLA